MTKKILSILTILTLCGMVSCNDKKHKKITTQTMETLNVEKKDSEKVNLTTEKRKSITDFLPKGYRIFEKVYGDVNKDGLEDCIIVIKGINKNNIIKDENRGELDRNRRGLIILLNRNENYELAVKNYECFSSENENGGVYYAPELSVEIDKGNLYILYAHGRYGYWRYTFRFQNSDFELIGYNASDNRGPVVSSEISINYLTKKKIVKENTNEKAESGEEVFKETVTRINKSKRTKLSEIKDFDELEASED